MKVSERRPKVVLLPQKEQTKREAALDRDTHYLAEVMAELFLVEKMTGRTGLPKRVCLAFNDVLISAVSLAEERAECRAQSRLPGL